MLHRLAAQIAVEPVAMPFATVTGRSIESA